VAKELLDLRRENITSAGVGPQVDFTL
jgi:hypothetical protein